MMRLTYFFLITIFITGCAVDTPAPADPTSTAPRPMPSVTAGVGVDLDAELLYPHSESVVEMGQGVKFIVSVKDQASSQVTDAQVSIQLFDPSEKLVGEIPLESGAGNVYRSEAWDIPHRTIQGDWRAVINVMRDGVPSQSENTFPVLPTTSEILLEKYGFWLDAPRLRGVVPSLFAERGDVHDGLIRWGGQIPAQHILPGNFVEVYWRTGDFGLNDAESVRRFMLEELGDLGFTPIRSIGPFEKTVFKNWEAWKVGGRGQFKQDQVEWMVFYAPEVGKTYSIGTTVIQPPSGIDAHNFLRKSFEVHPEVNANGVAPEPLPLHLLPPPEAIRPPLGERYFGIQNPVIIEWTPVKELAEDEYYDVAIDSNYTETNTVRHYTTRETQFTIPVELYSTPNCHVFNWRITLMRKTGETPTRDPVGEQISHRSLYNYVEWYYPPGEEQPFPSSCPNPQF